MTDREAKERILQATIGLLAEGEDAARITVRRIAERAEVGVGAINYYFQSKDNLLNEAVDHLMQAEAARWFEVPPGTPDDPESRLRALLKQTSKIGLRYPHLLEISVRYELLEGSFSVAEMVIPLLRAILAGRMTDAEIRLTAVQLVASIQVLFLRRDEVQRITGLNIADEAQLDAILDRLIDNTLGRKLGARL